MKTLRYKIRYLAFAWAFLECLGYSGLIYGWGSLVYVLKDEGLYLDLCKNDSAQLQNSNETEDSYDPNCDERDGIFNLAFTIASAILGLGIFILGLVSLRFGTRITRLTGTVIFLVGSLCIAATSNDVPWLIFPGLSLIAVAGSCILATNMQVSFLFPVWGSAILSLLSGAFDASAAIQLLVKVGYENGISRSTSYYILTAVFTLSLISTFFFLPKHFIEKQKDVEIVMTPPTDGEVNNIKENNEKADNSEDEQPKKLSPRSCAEVVVSPEFLFHAYWFVLLHLRNINYNATINIVLEDTLDTDDAVSEYTNIYLYVLLLGVVISFLPGLFYDYNVKLFQNSKSVLRRRMMPSVLPLILTSMIAVTLSTFTLFTGAITLYVEFLLMAFYRAFLYATLATYLRQLFPSEFFTTLYGVLLFAAGLMSLMQYALFTWEKSEGKQQVRIFILVLSATTVVHPLYQWRRCG